MILMYALLISCETVIYLLAFTVQAFLLQPRIEKMYTLYIRIMNALCLKKREMHWLSKFFFSQQPLSLTFGALRLCPKTSYQQIIDGSYGNGPYLCSHFENTHSESEFMHQEFAFLAVSSAASTSIASSHSSWFSVASRKFTMPVQFMLLMTM